MRDLSCPAAWWGARGQVSDELAPPNLHPLDFKTGEGNLGDKGKGGGRKG